MPTNFLHIEPRGFEPLIGKFGRMHPTLHANVKKAVEVNARHIKDDAILFLEPISTRDLSHVPDLLHRIGYKIRAGASFVEARIQPNDGKQSALGAIIEDGAKYSGPRKFMEAALRENVEDLMDGVQKAIEDAWNA